MDAENKCRQKFGAFGERAIHIREKKKKKPKGIFTVGGRFRRKGEKRGPVGRPKKASPRPGARGKDETRIKQRNSLTQTAPGGARQYLQLERKPKKGICSLFSVWSRVEKLLRAREKFATGKKIPSDAAMRGGGQQKVQEKKNILFHGGISSLKKKPALAQITPGGGKGLLPKKKGPPPWGQGRISGGGGKKNLKGKKEGLYYFPKESWSEGVTPKNGQIGFRKKKKWNQLAKREIQGGGGGGAPTKNG